MRFNLKIHLNVGGTGICLSGDFAVWNQKDVPKVAYQYIQNIKRETGCRRIIIERVIVNGEEDITTELKNIQDQPIPPMDDIFW